MTNPGTADADGVPAPAKRRRSPEHASEWHYAEPRSIDAIDRFCRQCGVWFAVPPRFASQRYCSSRCLGQSKAPATPNEIEWWLLDRSIPEPNSGCWIWLGSEVSGYGRSGFRGRVLMSTHIALRARGIIVPPKMQACHHCDNPPCVNPYHLFVGTNDDNIADSMRKGRRATGAGNSSSKLNEQDVIAIKADARSNREIARAYAMAASTIQAIKTGRTWRHV